jgi:hypothetical protein
MNTLTRSPRTLALAACLAPASALAGFSKPLVDVSDQIGAGHFAIDNQWSLVGIIGPVVVVALLAGFYGRDK